MQIIIIPLQFDDKELLRKLSDTLYQVFLIPIRFMTLDISLKKGWSIEREQLNSSWILTQLKENAPNDNSKLLGVSSFDLYTPIMTFLFGEAELKGRAATFSTYRFQDELYGLPPNKKNVEQRMIKEAIHELGHTFGLLHCRNFNCVMNASTYIEEFDFKSMEFCEKCNIELQELKTIR